MEFVQLCGSWDESPSACVMHPLKETVEKPASRRLMENVQMQGFRNPEE
jgi:hypothetical protein